MDFIGLCIILRVSSYFSVVIQYFWLLSLFSTTRTTTAQRRENERMYDKRDAIPTTN